MSTISAGVRRVMIARKLFLLVSITLVLLLRTECLRLLSDFRIHPATTAFIPPFGLLASRLSPMVDNMSVSKTIEMHALTMEMKRCLRITILPIFGWLSSHEDDSLFHDSPRNDSNSCLSTFV